MRQSNKSNKKARECTAFIYPRLSRDDNLDGESYSIGNQKKLLTKVAKEAGYTNIVCFVDDGVSGVTMDRPGFNDMMEQLAAGKAAAVFVKDDCVKIELNSESLGNTGFCDVSSVF